MIGTAEAALEAWAACKPDGMWLPRRRLQEMLLVIQSHIPRVPTGAELIDLDKLFESDEANEPLFLRYFKIDCDQVCFLQFWRAFGQAVHHATGQSLDITLVEEVQSVRDLLLSKLEDGAKTHGPSDAERAAAGFDVAPAHQVLCRVVESVMTPKELSATLKLVGLKSDFPGFWLLCEDSVKNTSDLNDLGIEMLTCLLLSWLHEAVAWSCPDGLQPVLYKAETGLSNGPEDVGKNRIESKGLRVFIHIYDVGDEGSIQRLNKVLAHKWSPLKFGGVFHAGVEVNGLEWSFGYSDIDTLPGISCVEPKNNPQHSFRQTVRMRRSKIGPEGIADIITQMIEEYPGDDYDLLRRNCCHFVEDFCLRLGAGRMPGWIHRLARVGAGVDGMLQTARTFRAKIRKETPNIDDDMTSLADHRKREAALTRTAGLPVHVRQTGDAPPMWNACRAAGWHPDEFVYREVVDALVPGQASPLDLHCEAQARQSWAHPLHDAAKFVAVDA
uniref:PPPDE domain-containing protein n=1 Tax=Noctiluca scintillans TaxID=2966 RepID=A0A7S0ZRL4_NOCSC|mmetsp:Transcript_15609/g.42593  ORF Transcript_15609/g.42593 Transcript_15609/m.42593 type:complete len:499 (+) Transcript_15609:108-1604(+)